MVLALAAVLFAGILQLGFALHVRNTLRADAAEGARVAAAADRTPGDGAARAESLARGSFGGLGPSATAGRDSAGGVPVVWVRLSARTPLIGWLQAAPGTFTVTAHALDER